MKPKISIGDLFISDSGERTWLILGLGFPKYDDVVYTLYINSRSKEVVNTTINYFALKSLIDTEQHLKVKDHEED